MTATKRTQRTAPKAGSVKQEEQPVTAKDLANVIDQMNRRLTGQNGALHLTATKRFLRGEVAYPIYHRISAFDIMILGDDYSKQYELVAIPGEMLLKCRFMKPGDDFAQLFTILDVYGFKPLTVIPEFNNPQKREALHNFIQNWNPDRNIIHSTSQSTSEAKNHILNSLGDNFVYYTVAAMPPITEKHLTGLVLAHYMEHGSYNHYNHSECTHGEFPRNQGIDFLHHTTLPVYLIMLKPI